MNLLTELFNILEEANKTPHKPGKNHPWKKDKNRKERKPRNITSQNINYLSSIDKKQSLKENKENIYQQNGYANRKDYLKCLAEDYGVDINTVLALANMLGPNEDFDGLVSAVEEASDYEL